MGLDLPSRANLIERNKVKHIPGWYFNAALRYADFTSSAVAAFSMPRTLYGSIVGGSSSSRSISCLRGIL
jgi:hypothetical protein